MSKTKGTKEWADSNVNIFYGCSNNCRYCYARFYALRFKRIEKYDDWKKMKPNWKAINKTYQKRKGRIMFPTSHDITYKHLKVCLSTLAKILAPGNEVLITTKPDPVCIWFICENFTKYKDQIQFRFTITSRNWNILEFFEPNAPTYGERINALKYAYERGYKTSVSIEPFLDADPIPLITEVAPFCTESIWLGIMSNVGWVKKKIKQDFKDFILIPAYYNEHLDSLYEEDNLKKIIEGIKALPDNIKSKIRLKDSIRNLGFSLC